MKKYSKSLFVFRRDLRLSDNTALIQASLQSELVIPIFIFDTRQVTDKNKYKSSRAIQFMVECIKDLENQVKSLNGKLYLFYGIAENIIEDICKKHGIDAVFLNKDYSPFSKKRDDAIYKICNKLKIDFNSFDDILLNNPDLILTKSKTPFKKFTAYYKACKKYRPENPEKLKSINFGLLKEKSALISDIFDKKELSFQQLKGGRAESEKILKKIGNFKNYEKTKDIPSISTTNLSAYIKFGTHSIREIYYKMVGTLGAESPLIRQLYWHDFFTYIAYHFDYVFGQSFRIKFDKIKWIKDNRLLKSWQEGKTGFPIVDAGMRQLNQTGFMHNRVRLITASFLVKDLHIDWREGEKYFAHNLIDYDPAVNNGNWQWVASTGVDAQPYFRIFNPWLQQKKFDPDCLYIKTWVPELKTVDPKVIHKLFDDKYAVPNYIKPFVSHQKARVLNLKKYIDFYIQID